MQCDAVDPPVGARITVGLGHRAAGAGQRWRRGRCAVIAAGTLVLVVSGGCSSSTPGASGFSAPSPMAGVSASSAPGTAPKNAYSPHLTGQITAINGATWTVRAGNGKSYTVNLSIHTKFGDYHHLDTRDHFTVGEHVRVGGTASGERITATEIRAAATRSGSTAQ